MPLSDRNSLIDARVLDALEPSAARELLAHTLADRPPSRSRQIFVNRTLRMEKITTIGFDLDWTLADYNQDALSQLAFELTLDRLVKDFDYPRSVLAAEYRPNFARRGLMLDTETGMVLKMNRHRYVGRAYHGRNFVDPTERARLYRRQPIQPSSDRFYFVDTLFELPEVSLFSELIEIENQSDSSSQLGDYRRLFEDTRKAVDSIHADGSLKSKILADLPRYLPKDPEMVLALQRLALGGRRLLLITNSEKYYTDALCSHLFDGALPGLDSWRQLFDLVVVESRKPNFFRKNLPFSDLQNEGRETTTPEWNGYYSGGCRSGLMGLLGGAGEEVLYVGDHIYGDILSSKQVSTWRTALVVRELEDELEAQQELLPKIRHVDVLRSELAESGRQMDDVSDLLALYRTVSNNGSSSEEDPSLLRAQRFLDLQKQEHRVMRQHKNRLQERISRALNPYWGSIFRQGSNKSLFGSQVDDFACIYSSRVSNFAFYGRNHYFRVLRDQMMHDQVI